MDKKAAEAKDPYSYGALGIMYYQGIGTAIDLKEAYRIAKIGAEYEDPEAMALLARMYREGKGVSKSIIDSFEWQKKAAEKGFVSSFIWLGVMYEDGLGTSKDVNEAITWYKKAYDKNVPDAPMMLCTAYYTQKTMSKQKMGRQNNQPKRICLCWVSNTSTIKYIRIRSTPKQR